VRGFPGFTECHWDSPGSTGIFVGERITRGKMVLNGILMALMVLNRARTRVRSLAPLFPVIRIEALDRSTYVEAAGLIDDRHKHVYVLLSLPVAKPVYCTPKLLLYFD
jgi:hypothetical protein